MGGLFFNTYIKKNDKPQFATSEFLFKKTCYNLPLPHWVFAFLRYRQHFLMERINDNYDANILEDDIGGELWRPIPTFMDFTFQKFRFPSKNILGLTQRQLQLAL